MNRRQLQRQQRAAQQDLKRIRVRKHLSADALHGAVRKSFEQVAETGNGTSQIPMTDCLMSGYAMFSLKDPSLLAFDRRRATEDHNLKSIYGIEQAPCDTRIRKRLDPAEPDSLRPAFTGIFRRAQRGKLLEDVVLPTVSMLPRLGPTLLSFSRHRSCLGYDRPYLLRVHSGYSL